VRKAHTGERPFVCAHEGCVRSFHSSGDLKSHEKTHSGTKEHVCGTCGKALSSRNALKVHERALHTLDRPFKCDVPECGMTYMTKLDLDRHANKHAKTRAREERAKVAHLEKRAAKAERQTKRLKEKVSKLERRERKPGTLASLVGGGGKVSVGAGGNDGRFVFTTASSSAVGRALDDLKEAGSIVPFGVSEDGEANHIPTDATGYFVPFDAHECIPYDDLVIARRSAFVAALDEATPCPRGDERVSVGGGKSSRSRLTADGSVRTASRTIQDARSDSDVDVADPTVQGVFAARDALATRLEDPEAEDGGLGDALGTGTAFRDAPANLRMNEHGKRSRGRSQERERERAPSMPSDARRARSREDPVTRRTGGETTSGGTTTSGGDEKNAKNPQLIRRRVLERLTRAEFERCVVKNAIPFQSWRRGLSADDSKRLEAQADEEMMGRDDSAMS